MPAKPSSHASVGRGPRQRAQGHRVDHDMLAVGPQAPQAGLVHDPGQVALALDGHGEAGEVVGLAEVHPRLGQVDHDRIGTLPVRDRSAPTACVGRVPLRA